MKKTIINHLLVLCLLCIFSASYAQNYNDRCFIIQIEAGTPQAEIDSILIPLNLYIEDGPTTAFINQFALVCVDSLLGFPEIAIDNNGEVDINGVIATTSVIGSNNDNIFNAIGLNYNIGSLPPPIGPPSANYRHPLSECGLNAFSITTSAGSNPRKVALLDTGIKTDRATGLDDFFDAYDLGWNIIEDTPFPSDDNGHGTHMASSITMPAANGLSSVLELKAYKTNTITGFADIWWLIDGINEAILAGVEIINVSGSYEASHDHRNSNAPLKAAIEEARDVAGILFVASAGNSGANNDDPNELSNYPASFTTDNILAVAALDCNYWIPTWANYGAYSVDIAAPGVNIWGIDHNLQYVKRNGASNATALTTGVAAAFATQQAVFDYAEIKCAIINGANKASDTPIATLSQGYLDANRAQAVFNAGSCLGQSIPSTPLQVNSGSSVSAEEAIKASVQNGETLIINANKEQNASLRIVNLLGQTLSYKDIVLQAGQNNFELEIPEQPFIATYICQIQYEGQSKTIKFIK